MILGCGVLVIQNKTFEIVRETVLAIFQYFPTF